jgi:signal transduction histidine kinase/CheY-like chemotaxis protein
MKTDHRKRRIEAKTMNRDVIARTFLLGSGITLAISILNYINGNWIQSVIELIVSSSVAVTAFNLPRFKQLNRATELVLSLTVIMLTALLFTGGFKHTGLYWYCFFPAVTFFWLGIRRGTYWTLGFIFINLLALSLSQLEIIQLAFPPTEIIVSLISYCVIGIIAFLYERHHVEDSAILKATIREVEKARRHAEDVAQSKADFLASMSHELRTPLNGVIGMSSILLETPLEESQRESATAIHDSASVLLSLINNTLDLSRLDAGRLQIETGPFDLRSLCKEVARLIAPPANQKGIEVLLDYDESLPAQFVGDKNHLRQVLINLAGNAVKFTPSGHVMLSLKSLERTDNTERILMAVSDTGIGIPKNKQQSIFTKFRRAETPGQSSFEGHGLGLAISSQLIEMMNSKIKIQSAPGKGSTFSFELALEIGSATEPTPAKKLSGRRILLIESYQPLADLLRQMLSRAGATVEICDGSAITETLKIAQSCDDILIDHDLPRDPLKFAALIHASTQAKPEIYLIKNSSSIIPQAQLNNAGISAVLTKPILSTELIERLQSVRAPEKSVTPPQAQPQPEAQIGTQNRLVLLVEDNLVNQKVARHFLERCGYAVDLAVNGEEGFRAAFEKEYGFIFMDCQMPIMDGYNATRAIRAKEAELGGTRHVPIIALTAHAMDSDREKCIAAGMDDYLTKPIDANKLQKILSAYSS